MFKNILFGVLLFGFVGCGVVQPNQTITIEQKCSFVRNAATTATFFALQTVDEDERSVVAHQVQDNTRLVLSILNTNPAGTYIVITDITTYFNIEKKYALLLQNAVDTFNMYFVITPPDALVGAENYRLMIAFGEGVVNGCELVFEQ